MARLVAAPTHALLTCLALAVTPTAHAGGSGEWYGDEVLAIDTAGMAFGIGAARLDSKVLAATWSATYFLGAPILHLLHGERGTALESIGLRLGLPAATGLVGAGVGRMVMPEGEWGILSVAGGFAVGMVAGMAGAAVLDAAFLAREGDDDLGASPLISLQLGGAF